MTANENRLKADEVHSEVCNPDIEELHLLAADSIGYSFSDTSLIIEALTHTSYFNEQKTTWNHNERLEFLGDAVLDLIVSERLMQAIEQIPEGRLTRIRASLVNEEKLFEVATELRLDRLILLGKGEELSNGRKKPSILSNCLEAVIGAVFTDSDFNRCREVTLAWFEETISQIISGDGIVDAKTQLQQKLQETNRIPVYNITGMSGPDHSRVFEAEVSAGGKSLAKGVGKSKKTAEKIAAQNGLERLKKGDL